MKRLAFIAMAIALGAAAAFAQLAPPIGPGSSFPIGPGQVNTSGGGGGGGSGLHIGIDLNVGAVGSNIL